MSGEYLLVTVLNTNAFGPRLALAPEAEPNDGRCDLICIREGQRDGFLDYLAHLAVEELADMPSVDLSRGRQLEIEWTGFTFHIDDQVRRQGGRSGAPQSKAVTKSRSQSDGQTESSIQLEVMPQALEFWLPQSDSS